jgi:hypothetical protein
MPLSFILLKRRKRLNRPKKLKRLKRPEKLKGLVKNKF